MDEFSQKFVRWTLDEIEMEATVTFPATGSGYPGIVLVAGSGPTDRDWCSPLIPGSNGSGKLIAEALSQLGYATIRFDKRASGPHVQENVQKMMGRISMAGHNDEVASAVRALLENTGADRRRIFALTSSEGAIHALNYQLSGKTPKFCGLILTGVPGRSVGDVAREQIYNQIKLLPEHGKLMEYFDRAISGFEEGKPYVPDPEIPQSMDLLLRSLTSPANKPFSLELWKTNPAELVAEVREPMLLLIGKKDIQVSWEIDGGILGEKLADRGNVSIEFPENANHVLKNEPGERESLAPAVAVQNYNSASSDLDGETLRAIVSWLRQQAGS